jgi:hypothetical protein
MQSEIQAVSKKALWRICVERFANAVPSHGQRHEAVENWKSS